jgi:hypothetical protein
MQQEFEQRGAIQPVLLFWRLDEVRSTGTFDGGIHLGGVEVKLIGHLEIGRAPVLQRELEQHNDIERPQHVTSIAQVRSIFK